MGEAVNNSKARRSGLHRNTVVGPKKPHLIGRDGPLGLAQYMRASALAAWDLPRGQAS